MAPRLRSVPHWPSRVSSGSLALLGGDVLAFLCFAALGRHEHGEGNGALAVAVTAAPFIAGWLVVAPWLGAFSWPPAKGPGAWPRRTAVAWLCAWPLCLVLRALVQRRGVPVSFDLVALAANAVLVLGWRGALLWVRTARRR